MRKLLAATLALTATAAGAAEKSELVERTFPSHEGKVILVDAGDLDLFVRAAAIPDIRVRVDLGAGAFKENQAVAWIEAHRPAIDDSADELRITAPDPQGLSILRGVVVKRARMELVIPANAAPDLTSSSGAIQVEGELPGARPLRLRAAGGDIELDGWAPEIEARTTSGDITIRASRPVDRLLARSASGDIAVSGGARTVRCDNSTGDITAVGLLGPASVAATSGDVVVGLDVVHAGEDVRITTSSGKVRVTLPPGAVPGGELSSTRGEIRSSYGGTTDPETGRLQLPGDTPRLLVSTTSGRIVVE